MLAAAVGTGLSSAKVKWYSIFTKNENNLPPKPFQMLLRLVCSEMFPRTRSCMLADAAAPASLNPLRQRLRIHSLPCNCRP